MQLCEQTKSCVVVIDPQEKLAAAMPTKVMERMRRSCLLLIRAAAELQVPILATCQYPQGLGPLLPELARALPEHCPRLEKDCFSCAALPEFMRQLRATGRRQLILCGMETHVCILQTAFELGEQGYQCFVAADATCSISRENYENALYRLRQGGHTVIDSESVLFEWLRSKEHPGFKALTALLKTRN